MGFIRITSLLALCVASTLATYGSNYHAKDAYHGAKGSRDIHLESANIHLDSPKILVDRPRIHVKESAGYHDDDFYIRGSGGKAAILNVHSTPRAIAPLVINGGHGGYGTHGGYESAVAGKVVNVAGPVVVAPTPIVHHDGPILVRRPVTVHKDLVPTQDHLEKLHFGGLHGGYINGGHNGYIQGHNGYIQGHNGYINNGYLSNGHHHGGYIQTIPIAHQERAPLTNIGHGLISFSAYHQPATPVIVGQPRAVYGGYHGGLGHVHGGSIYGGGIGYGKDIHGHGGFHGVDGGYKKY